MVAMVSPGPDFVLVTKNALMYPRKQALMTALGIVSGCIAHASYCIVGLAVVITQSVLLFSVIKYAGACYLIYIGLKGVLSRSGKTTIIESRAVTPISNTNAFVQGFLCNLLNPKLAVFLLSLFTQFISVDASMHDKALVAGVFVIESALYWPLLVLLLQQRFIRKAFSEMKGILDRVCGALLIYLGVRVALSRD